MIPRLPANYVFFLKACYQPSCEHPVCQRGRPSSPHHWFEGGPLISQLPFPVPDPTRPWGCQSCTTCNGFYSGHYSTIYVDTEDPEGLKSITKPSSAVLKQKYSELGTEQFTDDLMKEAAECVLLSIDETRIWLEYLDAVLENRKRGAAKAAATRRLKSTGETATTSICIIFNNTEWI